MVPLIPSVPEGSLFHNIERALNEGNLSNGTARLVNLASLEL